MSILTYFLMAGCVLQASNDLDEFPKVGSEFNQTKDRIGGGEGYTAAVQEKDASRVVDTLPELRVALSSARKGDIIYIPGNVELNLTNQDPLELPGGITLASDRGVGSSTGALLFTTSHSTGRMIRVLGDNVRITGLHIEGPDKDVHDSRDALPRSSGIVVNGYTHLEIDNSRLWGWSFGAIVIRNSGFSHVHHNYIHLNRRTGLGYGVVLYGPDKPTHALIEANMFEQNRHSIAASGELKVSYEARYNYVRRNTNSHSFDMHGDHESPGTGTQYAGREIRIHHNVFNIRNEGVVIRGIPKEGAYIFRNKFLRSPQDRAVRQRNFFGNLRIYDNEFARKKPGWYISWSGTGDWYLLRNYEEQQVMEKTFVGNFDGESGFDILTYSDRLWYLLPQPEGKLRTLRLPKDEDLDYRGNLWTGNFSGSHSQLLKLKEGRLAIGDAFGPGWVDAVELEDRFRPEYLKVGDFNGDGNDDLFISDGQSWYISKNARQPWNKIADNRAQAAKIVIGDFNGDVIEELLVTGRNQWVIYTLGNQALSGNTVVSKQGYQANDLLVGDFDGDGVSDLLRQEGNNLLISPGGTGEWQNFRSFTGDIDNLKVGDFNGDGVSDLLTYGSFW